MKIRIDPGHGGKDPGAIGENPFRLEEKAVNLAIAKYLEPKLKALGHVIYMTRRIDSSMALDARATFANRLEADYFVSLHANYAHNSQVSGMEVFCFPGSVIGHRLATNILRRMLMDFPDHNDRGVKENSELVVLSQTRMPAVLVEVEFLSNPRQLQFLADPANQERLAKNISQGIQDSI